MKTAKKKRAFFFLLEKKGSRINRMVETMIRGKLETQSWSTQYTMVQREPGSSV
jgi:hypothetical protein